MWNLLKKWLNAYIESHKLLSELGIYIMPDIHGYTYYFDPEQYDRYHLLPEDNSSV
jgi:hypothetical protein